MRSIDIFKAAIIVLLTFLAAYIMVSSFRVLVVLIMALIIASAVRPLVQILMKWHIPEGLAIVLIYLALFLLALLLFVAIFPPIVNQFIGYLEDDNRLTQRLIIAQSFFQRLTRDLTDSTMPVLTAEEIRVNVAMVVEQIRAATPSILNNLGALIGDTILIFVMGVYWLTSHDKAIKFFTNITPSRFRKDIPELFNDIEGLMGNYVRGVFLVAFIVTLLNFIPMTLFNIPNALLIAVIIGITTTVPMVGGIIGGIIAIGLTLIASTEHVIPVIVIFLIVQQIENHILSPRIMGKRVGLDPLLVIIYTAIAFVTGGVLGALLVIPVMTSLHVIFEHFVLKPYKEEISDFETEKGINLIRDNGKKTKDHDEDKLIVVEKSTKPRPAEG